MWKTTWSRTPSNLAMLASLVGSPADIESLLSPMSARPTDCRPHPLQRSPISKGLRLHAVAIPMHISMFGVDVA